MTLPLPDDVRVLARLVDLPIPAGEAAEVLAALAVLHEGREIVDGWLDGSKPQ